MPLPSEIDTPEMRWKIEHDLISWLQMFPYSPWLESHELVYEHGHWWLRVYTSHDDYPELTYSVVDTQGGFDYEEV